MDKATLARLLEKDSPFTLEAAKFLLGFETKSDISDLFELQQQWSSFEKEHRYYLLHGFLEGLSAEDMMNDWYQLRKSRPLPIPAQQVHKVKNEIYAKTKRYVIRWIYLRLRTGTYVDPFTKEPYAAQTKRQANQTILKIIRPSSIGPQGLRIQTSTDHGLKAESIRQATMNGRTL